MKQLEFFLKIKRVYFHLVSSFRVYNSKNIDKKIFKRYVFHRYLNHIFFITRETNIMKHYFTQILTLLFFASTCCGNPFFKKSKEEKRKELFIAMAETSISRKVCKCLNRYCESEKDVERAREAIAKNLKIGEDIKKKLACERRLEILTLNYSDNPHHFSDIKNKITPHRSLGIDQG